MAEQLKDKVYTVDELMEILKVTRKTIWGYINRGELKAFKMGRTFRITQNDYESFIDKRRVNK